MRLLWLCKTKYALAMEMRITCANLATIYYNKTKYVVAMVKIKMRMLWQ